MEHVHYSLNKEVTAIGGHYVLAREGRFIFHGKQIFYYVGHATFDSSCSGLGGCAYAIVPGFVMNWKERMTKNGRAVSEMEPINDASVQGKIRDFLFKKEAVHEVRFP